jgi:uncharacterized protein (TIGR02145 family)
MELAFEIDFTALGELDLDVYKKEENDIVMCLELDRVSGAGEYWVNIFPEGQASSPVFNQSVGNKTAKTVSVGSMGNGIYVFQVRARATGGEWSEYSPRQFIFDSPPESPGLIAPGNGHVITCYYGQTFQWSASSERVAHYNLKIVNGTSLEASPLHNSELSGLKDSLDILWEPGTYSWSVRAMKEVPDGYSASAYRSVVGWGDFAPARSFLVEEAATLPTVTVDQGPSSMTSTTATVSGHVLDNGTSPVTERGFCWDTSDNPTTGDSKLVAGSGTGAFSGTITGLTPDTYYYRAYAINAAGIAYSDTSIIFTIQNEEDTTGTFTDSRDGNTYKWVKIGDQVWMAENLAFLPAVSPPELENASYTDPYYYVYNYMGSKVTEAKETNIYKRNGVLYNGAAALNACPEGWHLPSDSEWEQLAEYVSEKKGPYSKTDGGDWIDLGKHLKSQTGWEFSYGSDDFGFNSIPSGFIVSASFSSLSENVNYWSSSLYSGASEPIQYKNRRLVDGRYSPLADVFYFNHTYSSVGFSVRCIKN